MKTLKIDLDEDALAPVTDTAAADVVIAEDDASTEAVIDEDGALLDKLPARAVENDDGSVTLPLAYPKTLRTRKNGQERERVFDALTFHRLSGKDQRIIGGASPEMQAVVAFAQSTRINQAVMNALYDKLDLADITDAGRVLNHFLTSGPKTGR
ncbi:hypothetical protein SAMN05880590_102736 [Rhizobium sp. RU35A]|uniref:hypothetical protein n=1 Tax=Rhizobium sp. RU35A TaxID=1907414 RepID=UPI0009548C93|nr:hypothetical protein [Rhizobium sp. RU35A]SIQ23835.1 hypothetical protein SAMN05880590_102736 [Rhizobium sp. RU35A]